MKKIIYIIVFFSFSRQVLGQTNIVPNWSFETYTVCPTGSSQIPSAIPWIGPVYNSTDYLNSCSSGPLNVPYAGNGFQFAKNGNAMAGVWEYSSLSSDLREYAQVMLSDTFTANNCYYIEFYANLSNESRWATNFIGANISKLQYTTTATGAVLNLPTHITNYGNPFIKDTLKWIKVSGTYIGGGGEKYLTIGNFKNDASTSTVQVSTTGSIFGAYYYLDAVSVYSINPTGILPWQYRDTVVSIGDSVYIGNTMGGTFTSNWYTYGGSFISSGSGIFVKPVSTSTYVVQFTVCGVPRSDTLKVTVTGVGINEFGIKNSEFKIYPNPNKGLINIEILNKEIVLQNSSIKIYDIFNREIKTFKLLSKKQALELQDINDGIYYLQLLQDNKVLQTKKIVKQ